MSETVPFTEAKAHLSELVDRALREHERFVVTRNGRPAAVLLSPEDLESLEETVDILQDRSPELDPEVPAGGRGGQEAPPQGSAVGDLRG